MKRWMTIGALLLIVAVAGVVGCSDDDDSTSPDTTAPTVSITSPTANATVRDSVIITASASDNRGIARVDFFVDGDSVGTDDRSPYAWVWRLAGETFGPHTLRCRAIDTSDNEKLSTEVPVTISDLILTANFTSGWLPQSQGTGMLFVSAADGTLLAELTWSESGSFAVQPLEGVTQVPGKVSVTVVTHDATGQSVSIVTNRGVMPASWTWQGRQRPQFETPSAITLVFENNPNQIGYVVSSPWADDQNYTISLPSQLEFLLHDASNDLFVVYGLLNGSPRYKWFNDVTVGTGEYTANLQGATAAGKKSVGLPGGNAAHVARLYGFPEEGNHHAGVYLLSTTGSNTSEDEADLYYPSGLTDFMSRIRVDAGSGTKYWSETRTGSMTTLEADFAVNNGDLVYAAQAPTGFSAAISGSVDQLRTCWQVAGANTYRWFVYSAPSDKVYALPALPPDFVTLFGEAAVDAFVLQYAELIDYPQLTTFDEVITTTFGGGEPFGDAVNTVRTTGFWSAAAEHIQPVAHHNDARDAFGGER